VEGAQAPLPARLSIEIRGEKEKRREKERKMRGEEEGGDGGRGMSLSNSMILAPLRGIIFAFWSLLSKNSTYESLWERICGALL
jgi:hypothetical protein